MESNIIGSYDYNQLIIKHDSNNLRKLIIPKNQKSLKKLKITESNYFEPVENLNSSILPHRAPNENSIYRLSSIKYNNRKLSKHFDVKLMEMILPWTFMSNSLREASKDGNLNLVIDLIKNGADINDSDQFGI
jgi:hypothetical protein